MGAPKGFLVVPVGFNPDGDLRSLELDANDNLKVVMGDDDELLVGTHGWIDGAWQKNPLQMGYSDRLLVRLSDTDLDAGTVTLKTAEVPAGEVWVIAQMAMAYIGTPPTQIFAAIEEDPGIGAWILYQQLLPSSAVWYDRQGMYVMKEADILAATVTGATATDSLYFDYSGWKFEIDQ